jgi:thiamine kinase-like enzyme
VKRRWGRCVFVIDIIRGPERSEPLVVAELLDRPADAITSEHECWLALDAFQDDLSYSERSLIDGLLVQDARERHPFARLGWIDEAVDWISSETGKAYSHSRERIEQFNASPDYCLLKVSGEGQPPVWLKAVPVSLAREYTVTLRLAERFPRYLPQVMASRDDWSAWLSADGGWPISKDITRSMSLSNVGRRLAELQLASLDEVPELLTAGCTDQRIVALSPGIRRLLPYLEESMAAPTPGELRLVKRSRLDEIANSVEEICWRLDALGVPDTLLHNDISPDNILCGSDGAVFADWAEAGVGIPFVSLELLRKQFTQAGCPEAEVQRFVAFYRQSWSALLSNAIIHEIIRYLPLLTAASFLCSRQQWFTVEHRSDADFRSFARSLARQMDRAAMLCESGYTLRV